MVLWFGGWVARGRGGWRVVCGNCGVERGWVLGVAWGGGGWSVVVAVYGVRVRVGAGGAPCAAAPRKSKETKAAWLMPKFLCQLCQLGVGVVFSLSR